VTPAAARGPAAAAPGGEQPQAHGEPDPSCVAPELALAHDPQESETAAPVAASQLAPIPFWLPTEVSYFDREAALEDEVQPFAPEDLALPKVKAPRPAPLVPWARLWPVLQAALCRPRPIGEVDARALVARLARMQVVTQVPRLPRLRWPDRVQVVWEFAQRLYPYRADQREVVERLHRMLGRRVRLSSELPALSRTDALVVLSDLGFLGGGAGAWRANLARLRGWDGPRVALVPAPPERWQPDLALGFGAIEWERPAWPARPATVRPRTAEELKARAERLLRLLSVAARVEPGLLREVRRLLPASEADAGTESDVWMHEDAEGSHTVALSVRPEALRRRRLEALVEPEALRARVLAALRRWRSHLTPEIWHEEALGLVASGQGALVSAEEHEALLRFSRRLAMALEQGAGRRSGLSPKVFPLVQDWIGQVGGRLPEGLGAHDHTLDALIWRARLAAQGPPPLVSEPRQFDVAHGPAGLVVRAHREVTSGEPPPGSLVITIVAGRAAVAIEGDGEAPRVLPALDGGVDTRMVHRATARSGHGGARLVLRTDRMRATLEHVTPPRWAVAMGRDRFGAWADFEVAGQRHRMRYIPPGRFWMGSAADDPERWERYEWGRHEVTLTRAFFLGQGPVEQRLWEAVMGENPSHFKAGDDASLRPVEQVSWEDCRKFHARLGNVVPGLEVDFPTEAEWEYAAKAGSDRQVPPAAGELLRRETGGKAPSGEGGELGEVAWYAASSKDRTHVVGSKRPNAFGLYDMVGNVDEWCADAWKEPVERGAAQDPREDGEPGAYRVLRGGSFALDARLVRASRRVHWYPDDRYHDLGLRLRARGPNERAERAEPGRAGGGADERAGAPRRGAPH
jgi:formylglycine-generating enzyme required for sulfatase activity